MNQRDLSRFEEIASIDFIDIEIHTINPLSRSEADGQALRLEGHTFGPEAHSTRRGNDPLPECDPLELRPSKLRGWSPPD